MIVPRMTCPVCNNVFSGYDHPKRQPGWLYSTIFCPQCGTGLRPDRTARITFMLAMVAASLQLLTYYFAPLPFDRDYIIVPLVPLLGVLVWMTKRARFEPVPGSRPVTPARAASPTPRSSPVAPLRQPAQDSFTYKFSSPATTMVEKYGAVLLGFGMAGFFYFLLSLQDGNGPYAVLFISLTIISIAIALWALFAYPQQFHVEIDGSGICRRCGNKSKAIAWQDVRQVRESNLLRRIVLVGRNERIVVDNRLENFEAFRESLVEHLPDFYARRTTGSAIFWCFPGYAIGVILCCLIMLGMIGMLTYHKEFMASALVICPLMIGVLVLACRAVLYVRLMPQALKIRRLLWPSRVIPYSSMLDVTVHESIMPLMSMPVSGKGQPGIIITLTDRSTVAITPLLNGPMGLYSALRQVVGQARRGASA